MYDEEGAKIVEKLMLKAKSKNVTVHLPTDVIVASKFGDDAEVNTATVKSGVPSGWLVGSHLAHYLHMINRIYLLKWFLECLQGLDVGGESNKTFADVIKKAKTIVWNG